MLNGVRNPYCSNCHAVEDAGGRSLRHIFNRDFTQHVPRLAETAPDGAVLPDNIVYLDVRSSNVCNLRRRSCGSHSSTAWYQDDPETAPADFRILRSSPEPRLAEQLDALLPRTEKMHFAGGEPMLMEETSKLKRRVRELYQTRIDRFRQTGEAPDLIQGLEAALAYMDSSNTTRELAELRRRTLALDAKRGESFAAVFPELKELRIAV